MCTRLLLYYVLLLTGLEPNKVTDIDKAEKSEDSEDSLPLVVPTTPTQGKPRPSPPRSRDLKTGPQTRKTGIGRDTTSQFSSTATPADTEDAGTRFGGRREQTLRVDQLGGETLADLTSLQRTKHGSPHPNRRKSGRREGV